MLGVWTVCVAASAVVGVVVSVVSGVLASCRSFGGENSAMLSSLGGGPDISPCGCSWCCSLCYCCSIFSLISSFLAGQLMLHAGC